MAYRDLDVAQRLQRCVLSILTDQVFRQITGVMMMGETRVDADYPTAYTDGVNKVFGEDYCSKLVEEEFRFLILHESFHVMLRHLLTWKHLWDEDPELANIACDYVINLMIKDADAGRGFVRMPEVGCLDEKYRGMDAGEVYRLLKKDKEDGKSVGVGQPLDEHGWEKAGQLTPAEAKALDAKIVEALQQGGVLAGRGAGSLDRAIKEITAPQVDWREQLREFILNICAGRELSTWRRPNRRYIGSDLYLPSYYSETVGRVVIGADTSGSINDKIICTFVSEMVGLANMVQPEVLDLIYWDHAVERHEKYGPGQYELMAQSTRPKGGGGTGPSCVSEYLNFHRIKPECVIMLSDGIVGSDWGGQWPAPVLWCLTTKKMAGTGKTIHIKE